MREWDCPVCGTHHDRDVNAAMNEKNELVKFLASQPEKILPVGQKSEYKPVKSRSLDSTKQETGPPTSGVFVGKTDYTTPSKLGFQTETYSLVEVK